MQRLKVQGNTVAGGPKDMLKDDEFDSWGNRPHQDAKFPLANSPLASQNWVFASQTYNPPMSTSSISDPYMSSYYPSLSFPYPNQGLGDGAWSNGSDPMTFLGGQMGGGDSHYIDGGVFGQNSFSGYNQSFNFFPGTSGDYSTWGSTPMGTRKPGGHTGYHEDYYRNSYDQGPDRGGLKHVEQGMGCLTLNDYKNDSHFTKDGYAKPGVAPGPGSLMSDHQLSKKFGPPQSEQVSMPGSVASGPGQPVVSKKMTWASIASQPAKPQPKVKKSFPPAPMLHGKHGSSSMDIGTWESKNGSSGGSSSGGNKMGPPPPPPQSRSGSWGAPRGNRGNDSTGSGYSSSPQQPQLPVSSNQISSGTDNYPSHPVLDKLRMENNYNPKELDLNATGARFFIIKSYSEDDIHRSIKYSIWCSTEHGNKRLDAAYHEREGKGPIYLFFSVNGSGHFCGMAQMVSPLDYTASSGVWAQDKWKGQFKVKWIYVKDVPNSQLRHIRLENNENKPVTNSRDTQEVPLERGKQVLKIIHIYQHTTSIFDDFLHYEKRQEEDEQRKTQPDTPSVGRLQDHMSNKGKESRPVILNRSSEYQ